MKHLLKLVLMLKLKYSRALVRQRTIPIERPPLIGEVVVGLERRPLSLVRITEELLEMTVAAPV
jgi:hypothetical protein